MKYVLDITEVKEAIADYMVKKGLTNGKDLISITLQTSSNNNVSSFDCANVIIKLSECNY